MIETYKVLSGIFMTQSVSSSSKIPILLFSC